MKNVSGKCPHLEKEQVIQQIQSEARRRKGRHGTHQLLSTAVWKGRIEGSQVEVVARNQINRVKPSSQAMYQILSTKYCNKRNTDLRWSKRGKSTKTAHIKKK